MERRQLGDRVRDYFFSFLLSSFLFSLPSFGGFFPYLYLSFTFFFRSDIRIFGVEVLGTTSVLHDDYPYSQSCLLPFRRLQT